MCGGEREAGGAVTIASTSGVRCRHMLRENGAVLLLVIAHPHRHYTIDDKFLRVAIYARFIMTVLLFAL